MSLYKVIIKEEAQEDLRKLLRSEPKIYKKAMKFIGELYEHPKTGLGHPEPLKGKPEGRWSREITKKHRLVYRIFETEVHVDVTHLDSLCQLLYHCQKKISCLLKKRGGNYCFALIFLVTLHL